jgi:hypothetical protein
MTQDVTIAELREMSARLRQQAALIADRALKRRMAEAALALAEIAEALERPSRKQS